MSEQGSEVPTPPKPEESKRVEPEGTSPTRFHPSVEELRQAARSHSESEVVPAPLEKLGIKEQAEYRMREAERAYSTLMDDMERSQEDQGKYFVKLGGKEEEGTDNRLLILKEEGETEDGGTRGHVVITKDGVRSIQDERHVSSPDFAREVVWIATEQEGITGTNLLRDPKTGLMTIEYDGGKNKKSFYLRKYPPQHTEAIASSAVDKSLAKAESPHKAKLEEAERKIKIASSLSAKINELPEQSVQDNEFKLHREGVMLEFVKGLQGLDETKRQELLNKSKDPVNREEALAEAEKVIEDVLRQRMIDITGAPNNAVFEYNIDPFDAYTGEKFPIPVATGQWFTSEAKQIMSITGGLSAEQGKGKTGGVWLCPTEQATQQFKDGKYFHPPDQRPSSQ